jgi:hypothetical protein
MSRKGAPLLQYQRQQGVWASRTFQVLRTRMFYSECEMDDIMEW